MAPTTSSMSIAQRTGTFLSWGPILLSLVLGFVASCGVWYAGETPGYNIASLYGGVLSLLSILCGFLATFYVFVATRSNQFLNAIRKTKSFKTLITLIRFTIQAALFALALTFYLMVAEPKGFPLWGASYFGICAWAVVVCLVGVNFWRLCVMFFSIVEVDQS